MMRLGQRESLLTLVIGTNGRARVPPKSERAARGPPSHALYLATAAAAAAAIVPPRALLFRRPRRCVLRPLDQLLRLDETAVLVLCDQLQADPAARLVHFLDDDVDDVASRHDVLDVTDAPRADVRHVEEPVGSLLQLHERAELGRLHDLAGVGVPDLRLLRQRLDGGDRRVGLRALRGVDEDRAVLLDVDLHLVVGLEAADRLAALADDHADLLLIDLDRRYPRRFLAQLGTRLGNDLEHLVEDELTCPLRLLERVSHDLLRDARDLDVHLERGDALPRAGDLEVHVAQVVLRALDVGEDDVVVALLHEAHRDAADRRLDRHAGVHERQRRAAHRAHRRRAVRLERLGDDADRVRELVRARDDRLERPLCKRAVTDVTPLRAAHEARLPDRVRREVVVVHVPALGLERQVVDALPLLRRAERERREDLRLAALEQAGAVRARVDADLDLDRPGLLGATPVGPPLVHGDLLADEVLVDRVACLLDVRARDRVLRGLLAVGRDRPGGERQAKLLADALEEQLPLRGLQLLRVLLGVGQRTQVVAELLAQRALDRGRALLLEQRLERRPDLNLACDVLVGRVHRQRRRKLAGELLDDGARVLQADLLDALPHRVAVVALHLGDELEVEPLRLAGLAAQVLLRLAQLDDLAVRELERLEDRVLGDLLASGLDHRQAVLRADDDEVEARLVLHRAERRVDDELAVDLSDADRAHRAEERQRRDHQRRGGAVDAQDVVRRHEVGGQDRADDLHLVAEALRPQRPDRPVDHARSQDRALRRTSLALEEAARDLAGGVHALLDVDGEREEVRAFARLDPALGGRENHRLA